MARDKRIKAIELLDKVLEFVEMTPDINQWSIKKLNGNPPRQIRLRQIESLLTAFFEGQSPKIPNSIGHDFINDEHPINWFLSGKFIELKPPSEFLTTTRPIEKLFKKHQLDYDESNSIQAEDIRLVFSQLVSYKSKLRTVLNSNSGCLEASSTGPQFSLLLTNAISKSIQNKFKDLDTVLESIINPIQLWFSRDELVNHFNYPVEELFDADLEFL